MLVIRTLSTGGRGRHIAALLAGLSEEQRQHVTDRDADKILRAGEDRRSFPERCEQRGHRTGGR